ncbi:MAG: hypothetical protein ACKO26_19840 [Planctomycetota bacterium]
MSDRPRAVAIMAPSRRKAGQSWTFERLAEASDRLAVAMLAMGIGPDCRVAMMAPPSQPSSPPFSACSGSGPWR